MKNSQKYLGHQPITYYFWVLTIKVLIQVFQNSKNVTHTYIPLNNIIN